LPGGANAGMTFSSSANNLTGDKAIIWPTELDYHCAV